MMENLPVNRLTAEPNNAKPMLPVGQKRLPLQARSNNSANVRVQPFRFAKQAVNTGPVAASKTEQNGNQSQKNIVFQGVKPKTNKSSFAVFEDKENVPVEPIQRGQMEKPSSSVMNQVLKPLRFPAVTENEENEAREERVKQEESLKVEGEEVGSPMNLDTPESSDCSSMNVSYVISSSYRRVDLDVPEYREDIYLYLKDLEKRHRPRCFYMKKQPDITTSMRSILVDWLVEVTEEYNLQAETFYLAVSYIDRFLSQMSVMRSKLQLVGTAAMFIASKFEEIYPPDLSEFVYITDDTYSKRQVLRMEQLILKVLSFDLASPTIYEFINRYTECIEAPSEVKNLAYYLSELSLLDVDYTLKYLPSEIAGSCVALANHTLSREAWPEAVETFSGISTESIRYSVRELHVLHGQAETQKAQASREKYKDGKKFGEVSLLSVAHSLPF